MSPMTLIAMVAKSLSYSPGASCNRYLTKSEGNTETKDIQLEANMGHLKEAFEDVADWCEKHLESQRGREIGMTFGAMLRAYGGLAKLQQRHEDEYQVAAHRELNAKAEKLLMDLSRRFLVANRKIEVGCEPLKPTSSRANMTYDPGPPR